jgi:hypothetical protein
MCLRLSSKKKKFKNFAPLKSLKKGVGSGVGSGSADGAGFISQRFGSGSTLKCHRSPTLLITLLTDCLAEVGPTWK